MTVEEKLKAVKEAVGKIEKSYGKGSIMQLGDKPIEKIEVSSTGSLGLDRALGVGGYPSGRIIEIMGPESAGKSSLAIHAVAECQKKGGLAAYIDVENSFDSQYAKNLGVDIENLFFSQPSNGEEALEIVDTLVKSGGISLVVVDSVAVLIPKAELEGEMGEAQMGKHARLMSQGCRKLAGNINRTNTIVIFINQLRSNIGGYGNPEVTTGGNALKFYSSVRLDIRRVTQIKDGEEITGNRTKVKVIKNKVAPPFKFAEFDIVFGEGISKVGEIIDIGVEEGILDKKGSWYNYGDTRLGQGRDSVKQLLLDNPELSDEIEKKIRDGNL